MCPSSDETRRGSDRHGRAGQGARPFLRHGSSRIPNRANGWTWVDLGGLVRELDDIGLNGPSRREVARGMSANDPWTVLADEAEAVRTGIGQRAVPHIQRVPSAKAHPCVRRDRPRGQCTPAHQDCWRPSVPDPSVDLPSRSPTRLRTRMWASARDIPTITPASDRYELPEVVAWRGVSPERNAQLAESVPSPYSVR